MRRYEKVILSLLFILMGITIAIVYFLPDSINNKPNIKYIITDKGIVDSNYNNITVEQYDSLCTVFNYYYLNSANDRIKNKFNKLTDKY